MAGTTAAPRPAATKERTPAISPPSLTRCGSTPAAWHASRVTDAQVVTLAEHDEVEAVEVLDAEAAAAGEGMVGRGGQDQRVVEERRRDHERVGHGQDDERKVDLTGGDLGHQLVRAGLDDGEVDAGMALVELDEGGRECARDQAGGGADGEAAAGHAREGAGLGAGGLDVGQDALHERAAASRRRP